MYTQADRARAQLAMIGEVSALADAVGAELWLCGGWAMDFFLGAVSREHDDIDMFTLDTHVAALDNALRRHGYLAAGAAPVAQQRDYVRDDMDLTVAVIRLGTNGEPLVGGGRFAGEPWPVEMLRDAACGRIGDLRMRYIAPSAQMEIKAMTPIWVPGRSRRAKDARDIAAIRHAIAGR